MNGASQGTMHNEQNLDTIKIIFNETNHRKKTKRVKGQEATKGNSGCPGS